MMIIVEHFSDLFGGDRAFSIVNWWGTMGHQGKAFYLVEKQKHNVQKAA